MVLHQLRQHNFAGAEVSRLTTLSSCVLNLTSPRPISRSHEWTTDFSRFLEKWHSKKRVGPSLDFISSYTATSRARLICGIADRGTVEPAEPTEPKEMTVLLQLPLANVIKSLVAINFLLSDFWPPDWLRAFVHNSIDHWKLLSISV